MSYIILCILFLFSGFFMKYSDDLFDINHDIKLASLFGVLCGITSALATVSNNGSAYIFVSILIGNLIALKIDGVHHLITLITFIVICLIGGIPHLSLFILLICIIAALGDEVGHEVTSNDSFVGLFFEYRFLMKIVVFLLAIFGVFNVLIFIYFILFEIAYEIAGLIFNKKS